MHFARSGGILLHPTSFPGRYGIGDLGSQAFKFLDFLHRCGLQLWQVLPLGPTGFQNSPYQMLSAFAGNPLLISLDLLVQDGLLSERDLARAPQNSAGRIDYGRVIPFFDEILFTACQNFKQKPRFSIAGDYQQFRHEQADWLEEYALFRAMKTHFGGGPWVDWPEELIRRERQALAHWRERLHEQIEATAFRQFLFFRQWRSLKARAQELDIRIIGDLPIFVAHDSADVWANQENFSLDENGRPEVVAGVPPDYFSESGQLWGNPLYRWDVMAANNYAWWAARLRHTFQMVDIVRIDHFRGFEAYWEIPGDAETAVNGRWAKGPGEHFFITLESALGKLPILAEDLGVITPEVNALRDRFAFPGMKILQFAFGTDSNNEYLPHNYPRNCVVYTGTHDNDTCTGWFGKLHQDAQIHGGKKISNEQRLALKYMGCELTKNIHWEFIRLAFSSVAQSAILPLQDILGLGNEARMNLPGKAEGNWQWRYKEDQLGQEIIEKLSELTWLYGRSSYFC
jgi:4-alpha-glucanotransferase